MDGEKEKGEVKENEENESKYILRGRGGGIRA